MKNFILILFLLIQINIYSETDNKDAEFMFSIGFSFYTGEELEEDYKKAFKWFEKASNKNNLAGKYYLAKCYTYGNGVEINHRKAISFFNEAIKKGYNGKTESKTSWWQLKKNVYNKIKILANKNDSDAQLEMGRIYFYGSKSFRGNYKKAVEWFQKASVQKNPEAVFMLGLAYHYGKGVNEDYKKSLEFFEKAKDLNYLEANYYIGNAYYYGLGVEQDFKKAFQLYLKAAENNNSYAKAALAECYYYARGVSQNLNKYFALVKENAKRGITEAEYNLGLCYLIGRGTKIDEKKALGLIEKTAKKGYPKAQYILGDCYYYGLGTKINYKKAVEWFQKAVNNNNIGAMNSLARCYEKGHGVKVNIQKTIEYYKLAVLLNSYQAMNNLAYHYAVEEINLEEAEKLIKKALLKDETNPSFIDTYGWVLYKQKKYQDAIKQLLVADKLDEKQAEIKIHLAECFMKLNNLDKAKEYLDKAFPFATSAEEKNIIKDLLLELNKK